MSQQKTIPQLINHTNNVIQRLKTSLTYYAPFGQSLTQMDGVGAAYSLCAHRLVSKFERPDPSKTDELKQKCFIDWLEHERVLESYDLYEGLKSLSPEDKKIVYLGKQSLHQWLGKQKFKLTDADLDWTPGATFVPTEGLTSVRQKLLDLRHWTVTYEAREDALELIWNNNTLMMCSIEHLIRLFPVLTDQVSRLYNNKQEFFSLVSEFLFTYVTGARGASVPKSNEKRRFINIEPMFNMLLQRCVASVIKRVLKSLGNDLETGQQDHRLLISNFLYATIDLKNASDSHHFDSAEFMFPLNVFKKMRQWRSYTTTLELKGVGEIQVNNFKLSSMGNGYTFESMTIHLLAIARVLDDTARVYGDDIIIKAEVAPQFIRCIRALGWVTNNDKTFISGSFRESCGGFYHLDVGYVTSYDFHYCETIQDVFTIANKLRRLADWPGFRQAWLDILKEIPAMHKGPVSHSSDLNQLWVEDPKYLRQHRKNPGCFRRWKKRSYLITTAQQLWQKEVVCILTSFEFKNFKVWSAMSEVTTTFDIGFYLFAGMRTNDYVRGQGRWRPVETVIFDDGSFMRLGEVARIRRSILAAVQSRVTSIEYSRGRHVNDVIERNLTCVP